MYFQKLGHENRFKNLPNLANKRQRVGLITWFYSIFIQVLCCWHVVAACSATYVTRKIFYKLDLFFGVCSKGTLLLIQIDQQPYNYAFTMGPYIIVAE